jgi:hypothetical protein
VQDLLVGGSHAHEIGLDLIGTDNSSALDDTAANPVRIVSLLQQGGVEPAVEDKTGARADDERVTGEESGDRVTMEPPPEAMIVGAA